MPQARYNKEKVCEHCGDKYTAARSSSRFCGDRCRVRHHRWKDSTVTMPKNQAIDAITQISRMMEGELSYEAILALKTIGKIARMYGDAANVGSWWRCQKCWQAVKKEIPLDNDCSCGKCEDAKWKLQRTMI